MYKKIINLTIFIFIIFIFYLSFKNYQILCISLKDTSIMFIDNVFPFLFITIFINNLLIDLKLPYYFQKIFKNKYLYIFFMSILSGSPTSAIIIRKHLENRKLTEKNASLMLSFTTFNSPLFLYSYLNKLFQNKIIIIKIIMTIYIANIIIFIVFNLTIEKSNEIELTYSDNNILSSITNSIKSSIGAIINIYATILIFKMISDLLLSPTSFLRGFIEVTQGLQALTIVNVPSKIKELLSLVILNFSGLSIHIQICNVLKDYNIDYKYFYLSRIIYIVISLIAVLF